MKIKLALAFFLILITGTLRAQQDSAKVGKKRHVFSLFSVSLGGGIVHNDLGELNSTLKSYKLANLNENQPGAYISFICLEGRLREFVDVMNTTRNKTLDNTQVELSGTNTSFSLGFNTLNSEKFALWIMPGIVFGYNNLSITQTNPSQVSFSSLVKNANSISMRDQTIGMKLGICGQYIFRWMDDLKMGVGLSAGFQETLKYDPWQTESKQTVTDIPHIGKDLFYGLFTLTFY